MNVIASAIQAIVSWFRRVARTLPGYILGGAIYLAVLWLAWNLQPKDDTVRRSLNVGLCFLGGSFGWVVGILLSPQSLMQRRQFIVYGRAVSAFASGYIVSKLDPVFASAMKSPPEQLVLGARLVMFMTCFLIGILFVYVGRGIVSMPAQSTSQHPLSPAP